MTELSQMAGRKHFFGVGLVCHDSVRFWTHWVLSVARADLSRDVLGRKSKVALARKEQEHSMLPATLACNNMYNQKIVMDANINARYHQNHHFVWRTAKSK